MEGYTCQRKQEYATEKLFAVHGHERTKSIIMSDETDPDAKDLDAMIREDAIHNSGMGDAPNTAPENAQSQSANQTPIQRLLARAAHISGNLQLACTNTRDTQQLVDIDREACTQLLAELDNWERVITDLEKACSNLFIKATDGNNRGTPIVQEESGSQQAHLLAKIAEQETKIRELEAQLSNIKTDCDRVEQSSEQEESNGSNGAVNRLIIATTDRGNLKFPLHKQIISIGRSPQNDIHIRSRFISRYHARIVCDKDGAIIEDLNSSNGVSVNSHRAKRQSLRSGDLIDLGRTQLRYIDLSDGSPSEGQA